jgi:hypothetical protein
MLECMYDYWWVTGVVRGLVKRGVMGTGLNDECSTPNDTRLEAFALEGTVAVGSLPRWRRRRLSPQYCFEFGLPSLLPMLCYLCKSVKET